jgi:hypothetical protein
MQDRVLVKRNIFMIPHRVAWIATKNNNQAGTHPYNYAFAGKSELVCRIEPVGPSVRDSPAVALVTRLMFKELTERTA